MTPSLSLQGRTALIAGAATGIGRATALLAEIRTGGGNAMVIEADVSNAAAVQAMADAAGTVDGLVNNAGTIQEQPFHETTEAAWDRLLGGDLKGVFLVSLEYMSAEWVEKELAIPQHRLGAPEDIAATALFLASDLSGFYTGQVPGSNGRSVMP